MTSFAYWLPSGIIIVEIQKHVSDFRFTRIVISNNPQYSLEIRGQQATIWSYRFINSLLL